MALCITIKSVALLGHLYASIALICLANQSSAWLFNMYHALFFCYISMLVIAGYSPACLLKDLQAVQEDWIGLRELHDRGRIVFDEIPGAHMHFTLQYFEEHVVSRYLRGSRAALGPSGSEEPQALADVR